jgi:hypothetical protein
VHLDHVLKKWTQKTKKNEDHDMNADRGRLALDDGLFMSEVLNCVYFATGGFALANYTK